MKATLESYSNTKQKHNSRKRSIFDENFNPFSTKWLSTLNSLSVFDHFMGLALKGLKTA